MMMRCLIACLVCLPLAAGVARAQEAGGDPSADAGAAPVTVEIKTQDVAPIEPFPEGFRSLFYTEKEYKALKDSLARRVPPDQRKSARDSMSAEDIILEEGKNVKKAQPPRILHLSGLVYTAPSDWTLWLNGMRVTPGHLPETVTALDVRKDYIDLKWLDEVSGEIIPVRLRPHQQFNIDTKTFLTGTTPPPAPPAPVSPDGEDLTTP